MVYACPNHPKIKQDKPGSCPKCGRRKVKSVIQPAIWKNYFPLVSIISFLVIATLLLGFTDYHNGAYTLKKTLSYFMGGFFLIFGSFKLINLKGFAKGYSMYDLLAKRIFAYGYFYPFIEIFFGLGVIILFRDSKLLLILEFLVMAFSGIGVLNKTVKKEKLQCVCLGTLLKAPLAKITLLEDFGMALLALLMLVL